MTKKLLVSSLLLSTALSATAFAAVDLGGDPGGGGGGGGAGGGGTEPVSIAKSFSWAPEWGYGDWGAGLYAGGNIVATPAASLSQRDKITGEGKLEAYARLAGTRHRLIGLRSNAAVENGRSADFFAAAAVGSSDFWTTSQHSTLPNNIATLIQPAWDKTLFDSRLGIWVGPVPVTFKAQVTGRLGAGLNASLNLTRYGLVFNPTAGATLHASAAIGGEYCALGVCAGASAGVYTDLTLFSVAVPMRAEAGFTPYPNGMSVGMTLRGDVTVSTLGGALYAFAEAHLGSLSYSWSTDLLHWAGITSTASLFNFTGAACLVGSCVNQVIFTGIGK